MEQQTITIGVAALAIGVLLGAYALPEKTPQANMHMMSDGTMMQNENMHSAMQGMTAGLAGKTGDAFDKAFLEEMIVHHEGAIDMAEILLANTARPELKMLGENIISAQTGEVAIMRGWLEAWF
jgi:uncharacterized protein (DUF305 family)